MTTLDIRRPSAHIAHVYLNRPDVRNAFNNEVMAEVTQVFQQLSGEADLRAVVFGGHGKAFCAGADLTWMRAVADFSDEQNRTDAGALANMLWTIYSCPVPVIARVHGDCYAGGVGLAAACDIVVAAEPATFSISEVKLGLMPATISPYVLRAIGPQNARRYFVTGERFDAMTAKALGLVHEVCASEEIDTLVDGLANTIAHNGPNAVRACKQLVKDIAFQDLSADLRADTIGRIAKIRASDEGREGLQSFLQKRGPGWSNG